MQKLCNDMERKLYRHIISANKERDTKKEKESMY